MHCMDLKRVKSMKQEITRYRGVAITNARSEKD